MRQTPVSCAAGVKPASRPTVFSMALTGISGPDPQPDRAAPATTSTNCCIPPRRAVKMGRRFAILPFWTSSSLQRPASFFMRCQHAPRERAVLLLHLHQPGQHGAGTELGRVAAINAAQQRIGEPIHGFPDRSGVPPTRQPIRRLVAGAGRMQKLHPHANLGAKTEQAGQSRGNQLGWGSGT